MDYSTARIRRLPCEDQQQYDLTPSYMPSGAVEKFVEIAVTRLSISVWNLKTLNKAFETARIYVEITNQGFTPRTKCNNEGGCGSVRV